MSSHLSSAIFNSMLKISIPKKAAIHRHAKINGHGCSVRIPANTTPRELVLQPSAMMSDCTSEDVRPVITSFPPSMWGDVFSTLSFDDQVHLKYSEEIEALKKEVRSMLMAATSIKLMILIDKLERLGLACHFETEIEDKLKQVYDSAEKDEEEDHDLFTTALRFRLLRQHQYHVSCDAFAKFVDKDNKLKESLSSDVEGLLSLYEAAHVRIQDENVLEQAVAFTTHHLTRMLPQLELESPLQEKQVLHALRFPLHRSHIVFTVRSYIDIYENDDSRNEIVSRLAKLNFNFAQNVFRNELFQLTMWWNRFNLRSKLPYFRDRLVETYIWSFSNHFEPHYSLLRTMMTKFYMTITVMDDTYDNYATLEEIGLLTRAIERWNVDGIDVLPDNLKLVYKLIMSFAEEFEGEAEKQEKSYVVPYFIEAIKQLARSYALEQKWVNMEKQMPTFEEYMKLARYTSLVYIVSIAIVALTKSGTKETIDWVLSDSQIFIAVGDIVRLSDDLLTYQRESKDGKALTAMDFYMKDKGASMEEAKVAFKQLLEDKWKLLNAEWVNCTMIPKEIVVQVVDYARMCVAAFVDERDSFTYPEKNMEQLVTALLLDSKLVLGD